MLNKRDLGPQSMPWDYFQTKERKMSARYQVLQVSEDAGMTSLEHFYFSMLAQETLNDVKLR